jgi:hypothetical protein
MVLRFWMRSEWERVSRAVGRAGAEETQVEREGDRERRERREKGREDAFVSWG